jgi:penicillin amidase
MPVVLVGRSETKLGWGLTTAYVDDQDVVIEELNPDNPEEYRTPDGWAKLSTAAQSIITVKDAEPVTLTLRWSKNGPVLPGGHYDLARSRRRACGGAGWTALSRGRHLDDRGRWLMKAQGGGCEAMARRGLVIAPAQNLMLADETGSRCR